MKSFLPGVLALFYALLNVIFIASLVSFIGAILLALLFEDLKKSHDTEFGMVIVFSFGFLFSSLGMIGFINGSMHGSTVGEIANARMRFPLQWAVGNFFQLAIGLGFIIWGIRIFGQWLVA